MLKKLLTGVLAASTVAVPLATVAWAEPSPTPSPPAVPGANGQNPANANAPAAPEANGQVPSANGQNPVCVVSANMPTEGIPPTPTTTGTPAAAWRQVATLQGSVASDLGLPAGQPMKVFCAPASSQNPSPNPQGQPASAQNPGQTNPAVSLPGQTGPQNPTPGE
jgi:hypothetical protein